MKQIELPTVGVQRATGNTTTWDDLLDAGCFEREVVEFLVPNSTPTDVQVQAIREAQLLTSRRNLLISSSTNSGKTLLGNLALLRGATQGVRALLMVPLRAIAQEKYLELSQLTKALEKKFDRSISVEITTGDYRLDHETMQSPPPTDGELVIATPERIESILRNPDFDKWIKDISVVVVDEAHLLGDRLRGASLEYVITSLNILRASPRFVLLSATLGDTERLQQWLNPSDTVLSSLRSPPLHRSLHVLEDGEEVFDKVQEMVLGILAVSGTSVLIFVYQTASADKLARDLNPVLGQLGGDLGPLSYHSRQSSAVRDSVRNAMAGGTSRCVVSTTALGMGVNLPATHVILRDLARGVEEKIHANEIIQMSGRAGRGNLEGHVDFILKPKDPWTESELIDVLKDDVLPPIRSALIPAETNSPSSGNQNFEPPLAESVLSLLSRNHERGLKLSGLETFIGSTLAGEEALSGLQENLNWLVAPSRVLAFQQEDLWKPTTLGKRAIESSIPLNAAAGIAQLFRDLLSIDSKDAVLKELTKLDLLILCELVSSGGASRIRFSDRLVEQVDSWLGQSSEKSVLFTKWIRGAEGFSKAEELLGSLGFSEIRSKGKTQPDLRREGYVSACRAVLLWQRSQGVSSQDITRRWGVNDLENVEERWRDNRLFMLGAMASLWEVRCFFYHLKEECGANDDRIRRVKRALQRLRVQTYQLMDLLAWCSPLGPVFVRLRSALSGTGSTPAKRTMQKLEDSGIGSVQQLRELTVDELVSRGVRKSYASQIAGFLRR